MAKSPQPENLHMRAVALSFKNIATIEESRSAFKRPIAGKERFPDGQGAYGCVHVVDREPPTSYLRNKVEKTEKGYRYRAYVADVILNGFKGVLLAVPWRELLPKLRPSEEVKYARCSLRAILNDQFSGSHDPNISISCLYARHYGDPKVASLALYGKDVLTSDVVTDILGNEVTMGRELPFSPNESGHARIEPNSCRLKWDDGSGEAVSLNVDRFGNFSFFMRRPDELISILAILQYIDALSAMSRDLEIEPWKRSETALDRLAAE